MPSPKNRSQNPTVSIIVPTRERAAYLPHCIRTCLENPEKTLEVLVLDNASADNTQDVVRAFDDTRVRYERSSIRLSMRDNFERGLELSRGEIVCFIGDDDGILPNAIQRVLEIFQTCDVQAVSAARIHYFWPDLLASRRNSALVPRKSGVSILQSKTELKGLLRHSDYYQLPCLYHGFVRREIIEQIKANQGRVFFSSQVDMYSALALSMEDIPYAFSRAPLVINGASKRSNGASHFGGGAEAEKALWKKEDDLGFLKGFSNCQFVGSLIVESALRYGSANDVNLSDILDMNDVRRTLAKECSLRKRANTQYEDDDALWCAVGLSRNELDRPFREPLKVGRLIRKFLDYYPVSLSGLGIENVFQAALHLNGLVRECKTTAFRNHPVRQMADAVRIART